MTYDDYLSDPVWADLFAKPSQVRHIHKAMTQFRFDAADHVRSLVSRYGIEEWLTFGNLRYPQISLSYAGEAAPPTSYTRSRLVGEHQITGCADARRILAQMETGAPWCWSTSSTGTRRWQTSVTAYRPRDTAHVFVVQLEGSKRWTLYDLPTDGNWNRTILPDSTPVSG
jgi:hypothetical protein